MHQIIILFSPSLSTRTKAFIFILPRLQLQVHWQVAHHFCILGLAAGLDVIFEMLKPHPPMGHTDACKSVCAIWYNLQSFDTSLESAQIAESIIDWNGP